MNGQARVLHPRRALGGFVMDEFAHHAHERIGGLFKEFYTILAKNYVTFDFNVRSSLICLNSRSLAAVQMNMMSLTSA